ncbi:MAG: PD-(D/E)XK nuclease family protein [Halanaerobiales bacterium]
METDLRELYFSQMALNTYRQCPLRFRYRYLDGLYWPQDWGDDDKEALERGKLFHRLAHRYYERGSKPSPGAIGSKLQKWFKHLLKFRPRVEEGKFFPEYELRLNKDTMKLVAKYDLVYLLEKQNRVIIYDWKTGDRPLNKNRLRDNYQTAVYLFILCSSSGNYPRLMEIMPGDISLIYWNPRYPGHDCRINYSISRCRRDHKKLSRKINEIISLEREEFEPVGDPDTCGQCEYRSLCDRG